ncbi:hypothetical protein [Pseudomonas faucium]|uniref:hypothetical protein n=1 Tax=Pseudomonas faucium TaxID=2740518 RepID=UPI001596FC63|nr:hypothetical protein [Pseudomonas faucium]
MASLTEFIKVLSEAPPKQRVQLLLVVAVSMLAFTALYIDDLRTYTAPDMSNMTVIEGRISGYPSGWEHNRGLLKFSVSYMFEGVRQGKRIYTYPELFEQSGLKINSKVLLTVERLEEGSMVRELATLDGRVLYDDRFNQQVIAWNNESIRASLVLGILGAIVVAVVALITVVRNRREIFQARRS